MKLTKLAKALAMIAVIGSAQATPMYFADRATFIANLNQTITDDFSAPGYRGGTGAVLSDAAMTNVLGETAYSSTTFSNLNLVSDMTYRPGDYGYCAGCNGNFRLSFADSSLSSNGGVYGLGLDIVIHTSRRVSFGDDNPANPSYPGTIRFEFTDGTTSDLTIPPDIGYYYAGSFFVGAIDSTGIKALTIGTEPESQRHFWMIDNLIIGEAPVSSVPAPPAFILMLTALGLLGLSKRFRQEA